MKIKALCVIVYDDEKGKRQTAKPGDVIDVSAALVDKLVASSAAVVVEAAKAERQKRNKKQETAEDAETAEAAETVEAAEDTEELI